MKTLIGFIVLLCFVNLSFGQAKPAAPASGNCFKDWFSLFKERGGYDLEDGTHECIITVRNGDISDCFLGKIDVKDNALASPLLVQKVDGLYEEFDKRVNPDYQGEDARLKPEMRAVKDAMSESVPLADGELIRLFFYKALKDKVKGNRRAPAPSALVK